MRGPGLLGVVGSNLEESPFPLASCFHSGAVLLNSRRGKLGGWHAVGILVIGGDGTMSGFSSASPLGQSPAGVGAADAGVPLAFGGWMEYYRWRRHREPLVGQQHECGTDGRALRCSSCDGSDRDARLYGTEPMTLWREIIQ